MNLKVLVDQDKCIGCGACVAIDPDNFDFNELGLSYAINNKVQDKTRDALEACPVYAISIEEGDDLPNNMDNATNKEIPNFDGYAKENDGKDDAMECECSKHCCKTECGCLEEDTAMPDTKKEKLDSKEEKKDDEN